MRALPLLLLLLAVLPARAQQGKIVFEATEHAFGEVTEGEPARHVFAFRNAGDAPLRLVNVRPSCGCTSPEWTKEPVAPGATGEITVVYDSEGRPGPFHKTVLVESDGEPSVVTLRIEGNVVSGALADTYRQGNVRFDLDAADVGTVERGTFAVHTFNLQNAGERPVRFTKVVHAPAHVQVTLPDAPLFFEDVSRLDVVVTTDSLEAGAPFDYQLVVETDDETQPQKTLRLKGRIAAAGSRLP